MRRLLCGLVVAWVPFAVMAEAEVPIDGTTASGDRIRLHSTGRWEYVDAKKAEAARPAIENYEKERALEQGGLLGIGRKIKPGDPDYNRGSMGGKSR
ncbi:MAG: hypothetical protein ABI277_14495 [Burkholderiaceae bacterium]